MSGHARTGGQRRTAPVAVASLVVVLGVAGCDTLSDGGGSVTIEPGEGIADFVEPGFPFIVTTVDARELGPDVSSNNVATRGVLLFLEDDVYAAFDPDLLRMAVGWRGDSLELVTMAQVSYQEANNRVMTMPACTTPRARRSGTPRTATSRRTGTR